MIFGMFVIAIVAGLQVVAWVMGFNGAVFAFTSLIIGSVAGTVLGFKLNVEKYMKNEWKRGR